MPSPEVNDKSLVPEKQPDFSLTIRERYAAAANEIAQRIGLRQQVQMGFVVAVFTILGWFLSRPDSVLALQSFQLLCALVPMLGIVFTCWTGQNDLLVGLLCAFCRACQQAEDGFTEDGSRPDKITPWNTPNWFSRTQVWATQGFLYRAFSNVAYSAVLFCTTIPMTVVLLTSLGSEPGKISASEQTWVLFQVTLLALSVAIGIIVPLAWWIQYADLEKGWGLRKGDNGPDGKAIKDIIIHTALPWAVAFTLYWFSHASIYKYSVQQRFVLHVSFVTMLMTIASLLLQHYYTSERIRILVHGELIQVYDENNHKFLKLSLDRGDRKRVNDEHKYAFSAQTKANRRLERIGLLEKVAVWIVFFGLMLIFVFLWKSRN